MKTHGASDGHHITVVVRQRPLQPHEAGHGCGAVSIYPETGTVTLGATGQEGTGKERYMRNFAYDAVLGQHESQVDLFRKARVPDMVQGVLQGYHATIFAYGQTGSGKTYCMEGFQYKQIKVTRAEGKMLEPRAAFEETPPERLGIVPRTVDLLFQTIQRTTHSRVTVRVSYVQIYNEMVYDLLNSNSFAGSAGMTAKGGLKMRWNRNLQFHLENLYKFECKSPGEVMTLYQTGIKNKVMASHKMNAQSSRSHSLFTLYIDSAPLDTPEEVKSSKLTLVDLAGSERGSTAGATSGTLQKESIAINKSLFALRKVITTLANGKSVNSPHIPFRDSKLTCLLKHSLGGSSLTTMIACISPSDVNIEENSSTLEYSSRAKAIVNRPIVNEDPKNRLIRELRAQVAFLQDQLAIAEVKTLSVPAGLAGLARPQPPAGAPAAAGLVKPQEIERDQDSEDKAVRAAERQVPVSEEAPARKQPHRNLSATEDAAGLPAGGASGLPRASQVDASSQPAQSSGDRVVPQVESMGEYLVKSMALLKQLGTANTRLRQMYTILYNQHQEAKVLNDTLSSENVDLRGKVELYEGVVVAPGDSSKDMKIHTANAAMLSELADLRREAELLRSWCQQEGKQLPPELGRKQASSGASKSPASLRRSSSARASIQREAMQTKSPTRLKPSGKPMSMKELEAMFLGQGSPSRRSSVSSVASGSRAPSKRPGRDHSAIPGYLQPPKAPETPKGAASDSNYSYSAISGSSLRITTTGDFLTSASGVVGTWTSEATSPMQAWSTPPPPQESQPEGDDGKRKDPRDRLSDLFATRNAIVRGRFGGA